MRPADHWPGENGYYTHRTHKIINLLREMLPYAKAGVEGDVGMAALNALQRVFQRSAGARALPGDHS